MYSRREPIGHDRSSESLAAPSDATHDGDPLSDVLRAVRLSASLFFMLDAKPPWVVEAPSGAVLAPLLLPGSQHVISYYLIEIGRCWCRLPGAPEVELCAGDAIVIAHGDPYVLSGSHRPGLPARPSTGSVGFWRSCASDRGPPLVAEGVGASERIRVACGFLGCERALLPPLIAMLPRVLHLRAPATPCADRVGALLELALAESRDPRPGSDCVLLKIGELMFVEVVRSVLSALPLEESGWLAALRDANIARSIAAMHERPAYPWTLDELSRVAGLSRSVLVPRFTQLVGQPPIHYLTQWRMQLAARMLVDGAARVLSVARDVGYESEAAFSRAFKRFFGMPPAMWRRRHCKAA